MSFANSFVKGLDQGENSYYKAQEAARQKVLDAQRAALHDTQMERFGWERDAINREKDAFTAYENLNAGVGSADQSQIKQTYGMTPQQIAAGLKEGGVAGLQSKLAGYDAPDNHELKTVPMVPAQRGFSAAGLKQTQASELDQEKALEGVLVARRDVTGIRTSKANQKEIGRVTDQRDYITRLQTLSQDPEKADEFQRELGPALEAFSKFKGLPANFYFDPETRQIVSTPYGQTNPETGQPVYGAPTSISLATAMPYLLAQRSLVKEYGDPEKAAAAMAAMTDAEQTKRIADATRTFTQAIGLSGADVSQFDSAEKKRNNQKVEDYQKGMLGVYQQRGQRESAAAIKEGKRDALAKEVAGLQMGLADAKAAGSKEAVAIYTRELQGAHARGLGMGVDFTKGRPEVSNADVLNFAKEFASAPSRTSDPAKPGGFLTVGQLSPQQQRAEAERFYGVGVPAGGHPDVVAPARGGSAAKEPLPKLPVIGDPRNFTNIQEPGLFGTTRLREDPVTGKRYSEAEYERQFGIPNRARQGMPTGDGTLPYSFRRPVSQ